MNQGYSGACRFLANGLPLLYASIVGQSRGCSSLPLDNDFD